VAKAAKEGKSRLSIEQLNAIDLLVTGASDREVAEAVGVHRSTVWEWRTKNPYFIAELNKRRKEVWGRCVDKLRNLLPKALDTLEKELANPDCKDRGKIALEVLRLAGLSAESQYDYGMNIGPEEAEEVAYKMAESKARNERWQELDAMFNPGLREEFERLRAKLGR